MIINNCLFKFFVIAALSATAAFGTTKWEVDPAHSTIKFKVKHLMVSKVYGSFTDLKGTINLDEKDMAKSSAEFTIGVASITTANAKRDDHLKSPDFFDAVKYPTISFKSTKMVKDGKKKYKMTGDLTMRGVTKPVTFEIDEITEPINDFQGVRRRGLSAEADLNRKDWGVSWNMPLDKGGVTVSDKVDVTVELELSEVKQATEPSSKVKK